MSQAVKKVQRGAVQLPTEHFWKCYNPQNELPLSGAGAIALHAMALGVIALAVYLSTRPERVEALTPPSMDVVEIQGGGGNDGFGMGPGVGPTIPGQGTQLAKVQNPDLKELLKANDPNQKLDVTSKPDQLKVKDPDSKSSTEPDKSDAVFDAVLSDAKQEIAKSMNVKVEQLQTMGRIGGMSGSGGGKGGGKGSGFGSHSGAGSGNSPTGAVLTKQQKRQSRWRIHFSADGKRHVRELKAIQATLALPTPKQGIYHLVDLSGPTAKVTQNDLRQHGTKVCWFNDGHDNSNSLTALAKALGLPSVPKYVVILLPDGMEQEMAELEASYKGVPEALILETHFGIVERDNGTFGPVVIEQILKDDGKQK
jgi:hypothetical protein